MNFEEQALAALVEATLEVARDAVAEALVLGLELPVGVQDLGQPVLREVRALLEGIGRARVDQRVPLRWPDEGGQRILLGALGALGRVVVVQLGASRRSPWPSGRLGIIGPPGAPLQ